jgi:anti-sigma B factor antagonist
MQNMQAMPVERYFENDVCVISLTGRMDSQMVDEYRDVLYEVIQPDGPVLVDMRSVTYLSSAGIRLLLMMYRKVAESGGSMVLVGISPKLQDVLSLTGFLQHFEVRETYDDAMLALG